MKEMTQLKVNTEKPQQKKKVALPDVSHHTAKDILL